MCEFMGAILSQTTKSGTDLVSPRISVSGPFSGLTSRIGLYMIQISGVSWGLSVNGHRGDCYWHILLLDDIVHDSNNNWRRHFSDWHNLDSQIARPPRAKKRIALTRTRKLFFLKKKYLTHIAIWLLFMFFFSLFCTVYWNSHGKLSLFLTKL